MAVLKEVRCEWASIVEPNTTYTPRWEIEAILSPEQAAMFADRGVKVKDKDGVQSVRFKRNVSGQRKDNTTYQNTPPKVVNAKKEPMDCAVGNGSLVNIAYEVKDWDVAGNSGVKLDLKAVQVLELVEFHKGAVDEFEDEGETKVVDKPKVDEDEFDDIY